MKLSDISIQRPVLATVMTLVIVLLGILGYTRLSIREYPDIDPPIVSVNTVYYGASPAVMERTITEPLEKEITSIEGIESITSTSQEQLSTIVVEFKLGRDIEVAAQDVRDRVSRARGKLPSDTEEPIVVKQDADAQAVMWISLYGKNYSPLQISDYANRYLVDNIQTVKGVGQVIIGGERKISMRLWLDPIKMAARGVTALDVKAALERENVDIPSGRIEGYNRELSIRTEGQLDSEANFNRLIVKTVDGIPIYLSDVGNAEIGPLNDRSLVRFNGQPAVGLGIVKQSNANTLEVARGVKTRLKQLEKELPPGLKMDSAYDSSIFIEKSLEEVVTTLMITAVLVILVIFLFLGNLRSTLIPAITIPVSLIGTFAVLDLMGFSINTITLLGLILSIGLVVDDAIVVLENIYRHIEMGKSPMEAAKIGMQEIGFAVIAITVALVAVFVPLAYMPGIVGQIFSEFSFSIAGAVIISTFIALTLAPMLCSRILKPHAATQNKPRRGLSALIKNLENAVTGFLSGVTDRYRNLLGWTVNHPVQVITGMVVLGLLAGVSYMFVPKDFLPVEDRSFIFTLVQAPEGATMDYTDKAVKQAENVYKTVPEVTKYFSVIALSSEGVGQVNSGFLFVSLAPWEHRPKPQQTIVASLVPQMMGIQEAFVFPVNPPSGPSRGFGKPVQLVLQGLDVDALDKATQKVMARAQKIPGFINVDTDLKLNKPELQIDILRDKAAKLGVSARDIASTLQLFLGGQEVTEFDYKSKRYDVKVQMPMELRRSPAALDYLMVATRTPTATENPAIPLLGGLSGGALKPTDTLTSLSNVVNITESVGPTSLNHYDRMLSSTISGAVLPFTTMGKVMDELTKIVEEELPDSVDYTWAGESKELLNTSSATGFAFLLSLLVVYLTLCAQFESFRDPFVIMMTVPLAVIGAFVTLFLFGNSLNVYSQIGMILLIGLVTKNGILIVEYANQLREEDPTLDAKTAVQEAATIRFRPILMTSVATIFGAVPLALATGAGGASRQSLGLTIVGGMALATMLSLFVLPIVYSWVASKRRHPIPHD